MSAEVRRLSDSIVCVRRASYLTCSYIVRAACGIVLVDAGMDSDGADVEAGLRELTARVEDVRAILLTHWHNDHSAGAQAIRVRSNARVYYHQGDEPYYTGRAGAKGMRKWISDRIPEIGVMVLAKGLLGESTPVPVSADHFVKADEIVLDDFEVILTPGHTDGHVSFFYRPARALFAGDALAVIGGRIRFMARPVTLDLALARQSLARCLELKPAMICPGHREPLTSNVDAAVTAMQQYLAGGGSWPLLG